MKNWRFSGFLMFLFFVIFYTEGYATTLSVELQSAVAGIPTPGIVIIDFIDGDGFSGSTATISNFSVSPFQFEGSVTETVPGEYFFTDTELLSSLYFDLDDVYSGFSFQVNANFIDPSGLGFPDSLVLSITDSNFFPLF